MNLVYASLIKRGRSRWKLTDYLGHNNIRHFAFARHALAAGFGCIGVKKGDKGLAPSFIYRELLASVNSISAETLFYDVDRKLELLQKPEKLQKFKAIIAVDYFGVPQNLRK